MFRKINQLLLFHKPILFFAFCLFVLGCTGGSEIGNPENTITFTESDKKLESYIKNQIALSLVPKNLLLETADSVTDKGASPEVTPVFSDARAGYSTTNIQEQDVDESDTVKNNGTHFFVAGNRKVTIVDVSTPEIMRVVSNIDIRGEVNSLYLNNNILVILFIPDNGGGSKWSGTSLTQRLNIGMPYWLPVGAQVGIQFLDVVDPANPKWLSEMILDGLLVSSRMIDGNLHIIQQFLPDLPPLSICYTTEEDKAQSISKNQKALESLSLNDLTPSYSRIGENGKAIETDQLVATGDFYCPEKPLGGTIITVTTVSIKDPLLSFQSMGTVADAHQIYASTKSLYVGSTRWTSTAADNYEDIEYDFLTDIYKFNFTDKGVEYESSGTIAGSTLNQFSFGEYQNVLRVAATTGNIWQGTSNNHVYCMKSDNGQLNVIGSIHNIAPGENLYSSRFVGSKGYLVTFVKTDPLFTLDLSDPTNPFIVGELKVPGYSDYIHPLGENYLLTIGKDTKEQDGVTFDQGIQLSIFDVGYLKAPRILHKEMIGDRGTSSEALKNHKAFNFWAEQNLLSFPVDLFEHLSPSGNAWSYGESTFTGLYTYKVTAENGFEFKGRLSRCIDQANCDTTWTRAIFINDRVYEIAPNVIRSAIVNDMDGEVSTIVLDE